MQEKKYIIIGVLNWGLGHATRTIPVIKALLKEGFTPVLASDGLALQYLRTEFPKLNFEKLPSYKIRYKKRSFTIEMIKQLPNIGLAILKEYQELKRLLKKYSPVGVISDNRLGFYTKRVPSVYITHQLKIALPFPFSIATYFHKAFINKYKECWVPDFEKGPNLSGILGHPKRKMKRVRYVGPLSRFERKESVEQKKYKIVAILSGPEPQRTYIEERIIRELESFDGDHVLVRGATMGAVRSDKIEIYDLASAKEIRMLIDSSEMVISRSGYSSIMDYCFLENKAILIPTPGQVEQEYLATYLNGEGLFYTISQGKLNLNEDYDKALNYSGFKRKDLVETDWVNLFSLFKREGES